VFLLKTQAAVNLADTYNMAMQYSLTGDDSIQSHCSAAGRSKLGMMVFACLCFNVWWPPQSLWMASTMPGCAMGQFRFWMCHNTCHNKVSVTPLMGDFGLVVVGPRACRLPPSHPVALHMLPSCRPGTPGSPRAGLQGPVAAYFPSAWAPAPAPAQAGGSHSPLHGLSRFAAPAAAAVGASASSSAGYTAAGFAGNTETPFMSGIQQQNEAWQQQQQQQQQQEQQERLRLWDVRLQDMQSWCSGAVDQIKVMHNTLEAWGSELEQELQGQQQRQQQQEWTVTKARLERIPSHKEALKLLDTAFKAVQQLLLQARLQGRLEASDDLKAALDKLLAAIRRLSIWRGELLAAISYVEGIHGHLEDRQATLKQQIAFLQALLPQQQEQQLLSAPWFAGHHQQTGYEVQQQQAQQQLQERTEELQQLESELSASNSTIQVGKDQHRLLRRWAHDLQHLLAFMMEQLQPVDSDRARHQLQTVKNLLRINAPAAATSAHNLAPAYPFCRYSPWLAPGMVYRTGLE